MKENFSLESPDLETMFAEGIRKPLKIVDIFHDKRGSLAAFQNTILMGLGIDQASMKV